MNSNYQWQKHQTNERIVARMKEADAHRLAKKDAARRHPIPGRPWNWLQNLFRRSIRRGPSRRRREQSMRRRPSG